jgi:hypothetical protein
MNKMLKPVLRSGRLLLLGLGGLVIGNSANAFYDPSAQRWINRDPVNENAGVNLYTAVLNTPPVCVDSLGLEAQPWPNNVPPDPGPKGPLGTPGQVPILTGNGPVAIPPANPVKYKACTEAQLGMIQQGATGSETCPCTGVTVGCVTFETCEAVFTRVGTAPLPSTYYWVPHRRCKPCPEGRYGNY